MSFWQLIDIHFFIVDVLVWSFIRFPWWYHVYLILCDLWCLALICLAHLNKWSPFRLYRFVSAAIALAESSALGIRWWCLWAGVSWWVKPLPMLSGQDVLLAELPGWWWMTGLYTQVRPLGDLPWFGSAAECILCSGDATSNPTSVQAGSQAGCPYVPWQVVPLVRFLSLSELQGHALQFLLEWGLAWMVSLHIEVDFRLGFAIR